MLTCQCCQKRLPVWAPLLTGARQIMYCPHCGQPVRLHRGRYKVMTALSVAAIAGTTSVSSAHPYLLTAGVAIACACLFVVFAKFVPPSSEE